MKLTEINEWNRRSWTCQEMKLPPVDGFVDEILTCYQKRFEQKLTEKNEDVDYDWDFTNKTQLKMLYDSDRRKEVFGDDVTTDIRWALNGGNLNPLSRMYVAWTATGFGTPTHVRGLRFIYSTVIPAVLDNLKTETGERHVTRSTCSLILKPPSKTGHLQCHTDTSFNFEELFTELAEYDRVSEWVERNGKQRLLHLVGGRQRTGATMTFTNLTPGRYMVLLLCINPTNPHPSLSFGRKKDPPNVHHDNNVDVYTRHKSPNYFPFNRKVKLFKRVIEVLESTGPLKTDVAVFTNEVDRQWWSRVPMSTKYLIKARIHRQIGMTNGPISYDPIVPTSDNGQPIVVSWPCGWPHGSRPSPDGVRCSIGYVFRPVSSVDMETQLQSRGYRWLKAIVDRDDGYMLANNTPFNTGETHKNSACEIEHRKWFDHMYIRSETDFRHLFV
jgi:hypothetical protein